MKIQKIFISALLAVSPLLGYAQSDYIPGGYKLVWQDNFDGDQLDENNWNIEVNGDGGGNQELQYYRRENVAVADGKLVLTARRENYGGKQFTSGRVNTQNKAAFKHGLLQARIKFPSTKDGLWPAYWMMGNDMRRVGWPRCGEMDIVELGHAKGISAGTQDRYFGGTLHYGPSASQAGHQQLSQEYTVPADMAAITDGNYHDILVYWNGDILEMYYDITMEEWEANEPVVMSKKMFFSTSITTSDDDYAVGKYFHKPFFFLFNLAVGGWYPGITDPAKITALPNAGDEAKMYVDFVKVYQEEADEESQYRFVDENGEVVANYEETADPEIGPDNTTQLSDFATKALDENKESTFDFNNVGKVVLVMTSDGVRGHLWDAVGQDENNFVDLNVNNETRFLDMWGLDWLPERPAIYEGLNVAGGTNSFGWGEGYTKYTVVNPVTWAGQAVRFVNQDISMIDDSYWLHFAMRGGDPDVHSSQRVAIGNAEFSVGQSNGKLTSIGDYKRDGEWYYFDIPVKALKGLATPLFNGDTKNFSGSFMTFGSTDKVGAELCYDNVFFYTKVEGEIPTYSDSNADLGKYGYKTLDEDGNPVKEFNIETVKNVIPLALDNTTWQVFTGNGSYNADENLVTSIDKDYTQGNNYYVWGNQSLNSEVVNKKNAFGQETWTGAQQGITKWFDSPTETWNGMGAVPVTGTSKDMSMIDNSYYLHIELLSDAALAHVPVTIGLGSKDTDVKLTFGKYSTKAIFADFGRDGEWYAFDIPVSQIKKYGNLYIDETIKKDDVETHYKTKEWEDYLYTISTGDTQYTGAGFSVGNIFFYQKIDDEPVVSNPLGEWTTKSLDDTGNSYFDFEGKDFINFTGNGSVTAQMGEDNIIVAYSPDVEGTALNIWSYEFIGGLTFEAGQKSGTTNDSFGGDEGWIDLVPVGTQDWAGCGLINDMGADLSALEEGEWYLHFAMRGETDSNIGIDFGNAAFTIGTERFGNAIVLGNYERNGEWYSFDIPYNELKKLTTNVFPGAISNYTGNILSFHTNGQAASEIQIDNIFMWRNKDSVTAIEKPQVDKPSTNRTLGIFDLSGRKVQSMSKPGMYIIRTTNSVRKVIVK